MREITRLVILVFVVLALIVVCIPGDGVTRTAPLRMVPLRRILPPVFEVSALEFTLSSGEVVMIEVHVRNVGGAEGTYVAPLIVDGNTVATKAIAVAAGNAETLPFNCSISSSGGHTVELDGLTVPIDQLALMKYADPCVIVVNRYQSFIDILQSPQIIHLLPLKLTEASQETATITHNYIWSFDGVKWVWELELSEPLYSYFKGLQRPSTDDYSIYVTHPMDDIYIDNMLSEIERVAQEQGFDTSKTVQFVAAFVQGLAYTSDSITTSYYDYPRYPIETLADAGGDCEDTAILLAALLNKMGQEVVLIVFPDHYGIGILRGESTYGTYWEHNGGRYFYLETTTLGWRIGEIPERLADVPAAIYALN